MKQLMHIPKKSHLIWGIWLVFLVVNGIDLLVMNPSIQQYSGLHFWKLGLAVLLSLVHARYYLGLGRGLLFFLLSVFSGGTAEYISMKWGTIFGSTYVYEGGYFGPSIAGLPLFIPLFWFVYIYTAYLITSTFQVWMKRPLPSRQRKGLILIPLLVLFDGLIVLGIDIILDPVMVKAGWWKWKESGAFFGVPAGNFIGWFLVTILVSSLFRVAEFLRPQPQTFLPDHTLLPAHLSYAALYITLSMYAVQLDMEVLPILGFLTMGLPLVFSVYLYYLNRIWKEPHTTQ